MATLDELHQALIKADAAGNVDDARALAAHIRSMSAPAAPDPTDGNSIVQNGLIGVGKAFTDIAQGAGQRVRDVLPASWADNLGLPTEADVAEKRKIDAPLMHTAGGKIGAVAGMALPAVGAAFVPGGQTLAGSMLTGAALGAMEPTGAGESVGKNALVGTAGGAIGYGVGRGIGAGADYVANRQTANALASAPRDAAAAVAKDAGYVIPPTQTNPTFLNKTLEGLSGKLSTAQSASVKNQPITNALISKDLGLPANQPITRDALGAIRSAAGRDYEAVKGFGTLQTDPAFDAALANITQKYTSASNDFPALVGDDIQKIVASIRPKGSNFGSDSAIDAIRVAREHADAAFAKGDKATGGAYKSAANALEDLVGRNLDQAHQYFPNAGYGDLLTNFQNSRKAIAKTYTVEKALNDATGNVNALTLGKQLAKGKPLSGGMLQAAQTAQAFPKAVQDVTSSMPGISPLDWTAGVMMPILTGHPMAALSVGMRPLVRNTILSRPYQNMLSTPSYGSSTILNALASDPSRIALQVMGEGQRSPQLTQQ